jgi:hypothetical protein
MVYYEPTYASSATPAVDVMNDMQTKMVAGGWTFVETFTSGTDVTDVYKSPAASNSLAMDYFIYLNRTATTATVVTVGISEQYDSTGKKALKYATNVLTSLTPNPTDFTVNDTGVVLNGASALNKITLFSLALNTARAFSINITPERVMVTSQTLATAGTANGAYVGIFDASSTAWTVCLGVVTFTMSSTSPSSGATWGAVTRAPNRPAGINLFQAFQSTYNWVQGIFRNGTASSPTFTDTYGGTVIGRLGMTTYPSYTDTGVPPAGVFKDLIITTQGGANTLGGDTLAVTYGSTTLNYFSLGKSTTHGTVYSCWFPKQ